MLYCADCGGKMYVHRTNNGKRISQYTCSQYSKVPVGKLCTTQHRINEDVVLSLVSEMLKAIAEYAKHDRAEFVRVVQEAQSSQQTAEVRKQRTRLATAKQRVSELEVLLCKIYEDNILGKLSDSRYATLDAQYEKEQTELTAEISVLEKAVKSYEKHEKDADRFIALIDINSVFRKRHRRRNRQRRRKRVWIANRQKHPSWNLLRMNCRRRQRIKSSPMQGGRPNVLHKKQSRHKIVCRPGRNCAWRRFPTRRPEKPKNT